MEEPDNDNYPPHTQGIHPEHQMTHLEEVSYDLPKLMWFKDVLAEGQTDHRSGHNLAGNINTPRVILIIITFIR